MSLAQNYEQGVQGMSWDDVINDSDVVKAHEEQARIREITKPRTMEEVRGLFGDVDPKSTAVATTDIYKAVEELRTISKTMDYLEDCEKRIKDKIAAFMLDKANLITHDGEELCTFKMSKPINSFDSRRFQSEHAALYKEYVVKKDGSRRFIVKGVK